MESYQHSTHKAVTDLQPGDILVGTDGGHSRVKDSSDTSGLLGFRRIETEHGHLYLEVDVEEVEVLNQTPQL